MINKYRIIITGVTSIHGWPIYKELQKVLPHDSIFAIRPPTMTVPAAKNVINLCITDYNELLKIKENFKPTHIIHCAGVCDLDVCEGRPDWAYKLNVGGAKNILQVFGKDIPVIFISTDLVFSGINTPAAGYSEQHPPDPVSIVGKTFVEAEKVIAKCHKYSIIRIGLPLGDSITGTKGAIDWIESRFKRGLPVTLFYDEWRSCVSCEEIGKMIIKLLKQDITGLYHFGGQQPISLYDIGRSVLKKGNYDLQLLKKESRHNEISGPPRIGNVSLNSGKIQNQILNNCFLIK